MQKLKGVFADYTKAFSKARKERKGFTMIELIVVVLIIGFLVTMSMMDFGKNAEDAKIAVAKGDARNILGASIMYRADTGSYPGADYCDALTKTGTGKNGETVGPWMNTCPEKNPWGNAYTLDTSTSSPYVYTQVGDGVSGDGNTYITTKDLSKLQASKNAQ